MRVQDRGGDGREVRTREREAADEEAADDDVAQEALEHQHVERLEDRLLLEEDDVWVTQTAAGGAPVARVQAGDEEVIEIDTDADDDRVDDERPPRDRRCRRRRDRDPQNERDESVVFRENGRSPCEAARSRPLNLCPDYPRTVPRRRYAESPARSGSLARSFFDLFEHLIYIRQLSVMRHSFLIPG